MFEHESSMLIVIKFVLFGIFFSGGRRESISNEIEESYMDSTPLGQCFSE